MTEEKRQQDKKKGQSKADGKIAGSARRSPARSAGRKEKIKSFQKGESRRRAGKSHQVSQAHKKKDKFINQGLAFSAALRVGPYGDGPAYVNVQAPNDTHLWNFDARVRA